MSDASLFGERTDSARPSAPLAVRMRPRTLDEVVGQDHVLRPGTPLSRLLNPNPGAPSRTSMILWGPPGTGKTTLATLVASASGDKFVELSAVTAGVKDVRTVIETARRNLEFHDQHTVLFIDEVHRFSKTQQDALLPAVENGWVTLVAATTENPSFSVIGPLLSRGLLVPLRSLSDDDVKTVIVRAVEDPRGLAGRIEVSDESVDHLVRVSGGDIRHALTVLEAAAGSVADGEVLNVDAVEAAVAHAVPRYDRDGDQHYDVASALIKSVRGSDVDAALHYLARMVVAGEDPRFIARRLVILASEDIGMADPSALQTATAAMQAVSFIGLPEARITLAHAVVHLCLSPKSNRVYQAINAAIADVEAGKIGTIPAPLRDSSSRAARQTGAGKGYRYPHDYPAGIVNFDYAPKEVSGASYYDPSTHGAELRWGELYEKISKALGRIPADEVGSNAETTKN